MRKACTPDMKREMKLGVPSPVETLPELYFSLTVASGSGVRINTRQDHEDAWWEVVRGSINRRTGCSLPAAGSRPPDRVPTKGGFIFTETSSANDYFGFRCVVASAKR